jgi:CDP-diacylglycerol---glycerol-3-phosphate 3-phosphatidyltransferase
MNLPNSLTLVRVILTGFFVLCFSVPYNTSMLIAFWLFVVASITDYLDGYLARKWNQITNFGKLMDSLADKILINAALILLTQQNLIPAWVTILILSRELAVTGLRQLALTHGKIIASEKLGKHKTFWQMITVIYFLLYLTWKEQSSTIVQLYCSNHFNHSFHPQVSQALIYFTAAMTLLSGSSYFIKNRHLLKV